MQSTFVYARFMHGLCKNLDTSAVNEVGIDEVDHEKSTCAFASLFFYFFEL